ncbi:unnamed protein product [Camellia sinensis]
MEYQLPQLTKMWSHLERQAGGRVKGMGEKQIEVDKHILRTQVTYGLKSYVAVWLDKECNLYELGKNWETFFQS